MQSWIFSIITPAVSHDPSETILIRRFAAPENILLLLSVFSYLCLMDSLSNLFEMEIF